MAFNIKDFLNEESRKDVTDGFTIKKISVEKLHKSEKNFYNIDQNEINELKKSIELVGVQENLVVREIKEGEYKNEYEIISGHKRYTAVSQLKVEGKTDGIVPCKVDYSGNDTLQELILIFTNSTQRERSDYEKMHEIQRVRELLEEYSKENDLSGRKRDIIAGILNTSKSTISRLDNIRNNMIPEFMNEYKEGKIPTSTANEIAGASEKEQKELLGTYKENGSIKRKDVEELKRREENKNNAEPEKIKYEKPKILDGPPKKEQKQPEEEQQAAVENEERKEQSREEVDREKVEHIEDTAYLGKEAAREIARMSMALTKMELHVLQNIVKKLKERANET